MRIFGDIGNIKPGQSFESREKLAKAGVHKPTQAGISGSQYEGADSIVLSGGYVDDEDFGDVIIYTGEGGNKNGKQVKDQILSGRNKALVKSKLEKLPVRVIRGYQHQSPYSPAKGYIYSGLYYVVDYWKDKSNNDTVIYRFRLEACNKMELNIYDLTTGSGSILIPLEQNDINLENRGSEQTRRRQGNSNSIVRDTQLAENVKKRYNYECQVCGLALETAGGLYAEAAHIKPLGRPHNGPDKAKNLLCLCPNHHVLFDNGGFTINDDLTLNGIEGRLTVHPKHEIDLNFIRYHREHG